MLSHHHTCIPHPLTSSHSHMTPHISSHSHMIPHILTRTHDSLTLRLPALTPSHKHSTLPHTLTLTHAPTHPFTLNPSHPHTCTPSPGCKRLWTHHQDVISCTASPCEGCHWQPQQENEIQPTCTHIHTQSINQSIYF